MAVQAFTSSRVVLPGKIGAFAVLAEGQRIVGVVPRNDIPDSIQVRDFGDLAILPGQVDWAAWGGLVPENLERIASLASAGVSGFKCFLIHPGIDEFTMINESHLR